MDKNKIGIGESSLKGLPIKQLRLVLANGVVTTDKVANGAITFNKLGPDVKNMFKESGSAKEAYIVDFWGGPLSDTDNVRRGDYWYYQSENLLYVAKINRPTYDWADEENKIYVDWEKVSIDDDALYINNSSKYATGNNAYKPILCMYNNGAMVPITSSGSDDEMWEARVSALEDSSIIVVRYWGMTTPTGSTKGDLWWDTSEKKLYIFNAQGAWVELSPSISNANNRLYFYNDNTNPKLYKRTADDMVLIGKEEGIKGNKIRNITYWGDTTPSNPSEGDIWVNIESSTPLKFYINTGRGSDWTESSGEDDDDYIYFHNDSSSPVLYKKDGYDLIPINKCDFTTEWQNRIKNTEASSMYRLVYKGTSAPTPAPVEGTLWWDDQNSTLKKRTGNTWITVTDSNADNYLYFDVNNSKLYKKNGASMVEISGTNESTKELYVCKFWTINTAPNSSDEDVNILEGDYWMCKVGPDINMYIFYVANRNNAELTEDENNGWNTVSISNNCLYLDNSNPLSPKLYKALNTARGNYPSWDMILIGTGGTPITAKPSWNNANDSDVVTRGAIREHYEGTNPKGVITTLSETVGALQEQVAAIDPNYELDYVPYDYLNGNNGCVNLPLNLNDNYEVGSINLQQVTSGQVRKAYTIKEFEYEEADIYHIIKKGEGSDSPSLTTFTFTSPTEPTEEGNITINNGDLWLNPSNSIYEIRKAVVTVTTSNNTTTRKINWPLVTKDILTKENGTYYHYVNKTKTEVQSSHVKEFTVVDVETINSIASNNQGSHSANYFDTIKALFDNIKDSINNEEESDRKDKDKRVVVLKLYDMFWVGKLPTVNSEIDERIFAPCNLRIEGVNDNCGMYIRGVLMNTTYSLELENVVFHNYRNDSENYGTIKIYVEDKYVDHVIVRGCTFTCSGSGYLMRTIALYSRDRTPFVITTPNVDEDDPNTLAKYTGDDGYGGNGFASVNYSQDFTKLRKYNCLGHLLIEKNTVDTCNSFLTSEYKYQSESSGTTTTILYSCRVLDNVFTVRNGTIIGLGSCNQLTSTEPQNANRTYKYKDNDGVIVTMPTATNYSFGRYRAQVSCPAYVVGNTFKGPNRAVVNSGAAYRCAVSGDRGTLYFLNNKIIDLVTVPDYTISNNKFKRSYYAAYDLYFRGSRLYVVNNEITNLTGFWRNNYNKGTFKSKGNANVPQFANIPNNIVKCYKYNTYKIDINRVKQLWNNLESNVGNDYINNQFGYIEEELGVQNLSWTWEELFTYYYKEFVDFSLDTFVDSDKNWVSNSISEINFSHNNVDYPYIRGVDTGSGEYPTKRMVLSYNNFKGDFVNGKNWKWTKQNTNTEERISNLPWIYIENAGWNYCTEPSDWWLFSAVLNTEEIEVVGNKFDTKNSAIGIVRRKYLSGQPSAPIHFTVESNEVDKTSLLYFGKIQNSASLLHMSKFSKNYTLNLTATSYFIHSLDSYNGTVATGGATAGIGITDYLPINNNILYIKLDNVFIRLLAGSTTQNNIQDYFDSLGDGSNKFIAVAVFYDENKNIIKSVSEKDEDYVYSPRHTHYHYTEFADKGATASDELGISLTALQFSILTIRNENIPTNAKYVRFTYFIGATGATTVDVEVAYSDYKYYLEAVDKESKDTLAHMTNVPQSPTIGMMYYDTITSELKVCTDITDNVPTWTSLYDLINNS